MAPLGTHPVIDRHTFQGVYTWSAVMLLAASTLLAPPTFSSTAQAQSADAAITELRPFEAVYKTTALGMTLDLTRSLTRDGTNYRLKSSGKNFLINMDETGDFRLTDSGIEGVRFHSKVKTLKTKKRVVEFDTARGVIKSLKNGVWTEHPWTAGVLDQFSQQQQLRLILMQSATPPEILQFQVIDGAKISDKSWRRLPNETLQTPIGSIEAIHYQAIHTNPKKRASEIWLAPSLDYLMVKTRHVERSATIKVEIKSLNWLDEASPTEYKTG